jgi:phage terminase small subunit
LSADNAAAGGVTRGMAKAKVNRSKPKPRRKPTPRISFTDGVLDPKGNPFKFTALEKKFVAEYLNDPRHNATAAIKAAGYDAKNDATFRVMASHLLKRENVRSAINQAFEALAMPKFETLFRLGRIAAGDLDDLLDDDGEFNIAVCRERGTTFLLKKLEIDRDVMEVKESGGDEALERSIIKEKVKITIHDPLKALELLGRHGKLFTDRTELTGKDGRPLVADDATQVVFYLPDNGRGDADADPPTSKQTTRKPKSEK